MYSYMSDKKFHTIESRDIVKEYAKYYRNNEITRRNREDIAHFVALNPQYKEFENFLKEFADEG